MVIAVVLSLLWLIGYARVIWPFVADFPRDGNFSFLSYPNIKIYRTADASTGTMSPRQIDFFSVVDGATGVDYNEYYFPCWVVSLGALAGLIACSFALLSYDDKT